MPTPGPSSSHRRRSLGEPMANRGYQAKGTDTTRPSRNSTTSARSVTRTFLAAAVSVATLEVLMPRLRECSLVFLNKSRDTVQFCLAEPVIVRHPNGRQPQFGELPVPLHVNVRRLVSVAGEEEKPIRAALQDGRTHRSDSASFHASAGQRCGSAVECSRLLGGALRPDSSPRLPGLPPAKRGGGRPALRPPGAA
jgi:hypothetical protein